MPASGRAGPGSSRAGPGNRAGRGNRAGQAGLRDRRTLLALGLAAAALGTAIAFAPSWDSYTLRTPAGVVHTLTAGNAFANPAPVIAGNVAVMAALVLAAVAAALWRPARLGAALLAGAAIPMVAQAISALIQAGEAVSPAQFGISPAQAAQAGLTISSGLTPGVLGLRRLRRAARRDVRMAAAVRSLAGAARPLLPAAGVEGRAPAHGGLVRRAA